MPTLNACDFAYPPDNISIEQFYRQLRAAGVLVVQRYLWRGGKGVTLREKAAAKTVGIRIIYGYEAYASSWRGGAATGVEHAADAAAIAADLGLPKGEPIYYAVDEDAAGLGMLNTAVAYVHAANRPDHPGRAYGQYALAEALKLPTFQAYAWSWDYANDRPLISKYCALYQWRNSQPLAGGVVDYGEIRDPAALGINTGGNVSATGPEKWDDADWNALTKRLSSDKGLRQAFHDAAFGQYNEDAKGHRHTLPEHLTRIENGTWVPFLDEHGNPQPLPSQHPSPTPKG